MLITNRDSNSDITIMNTWYRRQWKDDSTDKWNDDYLTIVYKDNATGKKHHQTTYKPEYTYYKIKDEHVKNYNKLFEYKENCKVITTPYRDLLKSIAKETNDMDYYKYYKERKDRRKLNELHLRSNSIMFSDIRIEDKVRFEFATQYKNDICKLNKGYFDIEVDTKAAKGDFVELGECPVNCCSYMDTKTKTIYTFILRDYNNPLVEEFENSVDDNLYSELKEFVINKVGGRKKAIRMEVDQYGYKILFFDNEVELIYAMFNLFHQIDPDFILAWNMAFDIPYIIERLYALGVDPRDVMCNESYPKEERIVEYYIDKRNENDYPNRNDKATISGNIVWLDQMIQFASRRKSKATAYPDFKLDTIGKIIADVNKLSYLHITSRLEDLPYKDFKTFVFYNIMDVVVQYCIEYKAKDLEYVFAKCIMNNTGYDKIHRQTVYLIDRFGKSWNKSGFVLGNNRNKNNEKPPKYTGAMVVRPETVCDFNKIKINESSLNVINNSFDEDFKALYPNTTLEGNMAPNTLIGAIAIPNQIYSKENFYNNENYHRPEEFCENMMGDNIVEFSSRWFGLASYKDMLFTDLPEYLNITGCSDQLDFMPSADGLFNPFGHVEEGQLFDPFEPVGNNNNPFIVIDYPKYANGNELIENISKGVK